MLAFHEKFNLIHQLHPITNLVFTGVVFLLALICSHPLYLLVLFMATGAVIVAAGHREEWLSYLKFSLIMILMLIIVNVTFVHYGETVLYTGPRLLVIGELIITLEALAYAGGMGLRLLVIISIFCLYTNAIHPDKVLKLFSRRGGKSVLVVTLATRLFPLMVQDYIRITEAQRCRGVKFGSGNWYERIKKTPPVFKILLVSSMERSLQLAESMHARGYGSGRPSSYQIELWRPRDFIIMPVLGLGLLSGLWSLMHGWSSYNYYPRLADFQSEEIIMAAVIMLTLSFPAILNWGWLKCRSLRSKI